MNRKYVSLTYCTLTGVILLCLALCMSGYAGENPCDIEQGKHPTVTPVKQDIKLVEWWDARHEEKLERIRQGNVDLLLIGDSITHRWETVGKDVWDKYYGKRNAVNLGFGGDRTQHVLWRLQNGEIDGINPKLAVLLIGTNNAWIKENTSENIANGIKAVLCELRTRLPNMKILVLGIFPKGTLEQRKVENGNATLNWQWEKNNGANEIISKVADNEMIFYLNINDKLVNDKGELTREIAPDLSHLSVKGFEIWAEAMESMVRQLLGE